MEINIQILIFYLTELIYYTDIIDGGNCSPNRLEVTIAIYGDTPTNVDVFVGKCNQRTIVSQEVYVLTKNTI